MATDHLPCTWRKWTGLVQKRFYVVWICSRSLSAPGLLEAVGRAAIRINLVFVSAAPLSLPCLVPQFKNTTCQARWAEPRSTPKSSGAPEVNTPAG